MLLRIRFLVIALVLAPSCASATGLFRAYVSSTGSDANDCTLPHPCRLLPKAISAIAAGGEIWMLDSANYNTSQVNVDRSVTILAVPGAIGSVVATNGGDAIFVGTPGIKVALRNLVIVRLGTGNDGVGIDQAAELDVEDCEISNMSSSGIAAFDAAARVRVTSTRLRGNNNGIYARGAVVVSLDHILANGNTTAGVYADTGATVNVANSDFNQNGKGLYAIGAMLAIDRSHGDSNATAGVHVDTSSNVTISESRFANNGTYGVLAQASPGGAFITSVSAIRNTVSGGSAGFRVSALAGSSVELFADGNRCDRCNYAFSFANAGGGEYVFTHANNTVTAADVTQGGSLNPAGSFY